MDVGTPSGRWAGLRCAPVQLLAKTCAAMEKRIVRLENRENRRMTDIALVRVDS